MVVRASRVGTGMAVAATLISASCKEPTEVRIEVTTNVPWRSGIETAFTVGKGSQAVETTDPTSVTDVRWGKRGAIGSLVSIPGASKDGAVAVKIVMGVARDVRDCAAPDYDGCIVARRTLRYVPGKPLRLPIRLHLRCENVPCTSSTTCNYVGECVSSEVDPATCDSPDGCTVPGEPAAPPDEESDGGAGGPGISSVGASADGGPDGSENAPTGGDAGDAAAGDAGDGGGAAIPVGQLALSSVSSCFRFLDGRLKCWGSNQFGILGIGFQDIWGNEQSEMGSALPVVPLAGRQVTAISSRFHHICAVFSDGRLRCWGDNAAGMLGRGDSVATVGTEPGQMGIDLPAVNLGNGRTCKAVAAGLTSTCAILDNDRVKCWGANGSGQLGVGDSVSRGILAEDMGDALPFVNLGTGRTAKAITVGNEHACALLDDDSVKCWGHLGLGIGEPGPRGSISSDMGDNLPRVDLGAGRTAKVISAGAEHTCAILDNDRLKCWGENGYGKLGVGYAADVSVGNGPGQMGDSLPYVDLGSGRTVKRVAAGFDHTCAVLDDDRVKCWGYNSVGQLGLGDSSDRGAAPADMGDGLPAVDLGTGLTARNVAVGVNHTCAVLIGGRIKCWGTNGGGELGLGDNLQRGNLGNDMGDALPFTDVGP